MQFNLPLSFFLGMYFIVRYGILKFLYNNKMTLKTFLHGKHFVMIVVWHSYSVTLVYIQMHIIYYYFFLRENVYFFFSFGYCYLLKGSWNIIERITISDSIIYKFNLLYLLQLLFFIQKKKNIFFPEIRNVNLCIFKFPSSNYFFYIL